MFSLTEGVLLALDCMTLFYDRNITEKAENDVAIC